MNALGRKILRVLEGSPMGPMSVHFLNKQCEQAQIDIDRITLDDIEKLTSRMSNILPFFIGKNTDNVLSQINKLQDDIED